MMSLCSFVEPSINVEQKHFKSTTSTIIIVTENNHVKHFKQFSCIFFLVVSKLNQWLFRNHEVFSRRSIECMVAG
jgi:hypothetical protein